ncbi:MAG: methyltransferase domain-containing protein [Candidatus Omnitrophica bacterium]|nr:methyltransferase domain-containing protein [Candidatus Omnitrophota bacterium]
MVYQKLQTGCLKKPSSVPEGLYVQYGCGMSAPEGWLNFDASPTLLFEKIPVLGRLYTKNSSRFPKQVRYGNIVRGLPLAPGSCSGVFASHVLEHLCLFDFRAAIQNTYRLLQPGGRFRLILPDLEILARSYLVSEEPDAAEQLIRKIQMGHEQRHRTFFSFFADWLGSRQHLWMWDFKSVRKELEHAGFVDIAKKGFQDSEDPKFSEVEERARFQDSFCIECKK